MKKALAVVVVALAAGAGGWEAREALRPAPGHSHRGTALYTDCPACVRGLEAFVAQVASASRAR